MAAMTLAERLAAFAADLEISQVPLAVVDSAKLRALDVLGIGGEVRRLCPALHVALLSVDGREVPLSYGRRRAAHCLRRETLDRLLQDAALDAVSFRRLVSKPSDPPFLVLPAFAPRSCDFHTLLTKVAPDSTRHQQTNPHRVERSAGPGLEF